MKAAKEGFRGFAGGARRVEVCWPGGPGRGYLLSKDRIRWPICGVEGGLSTMGGVYVVDAACYDS
jgi:hypothetical protein